MVLSRPNLNYTNSLPHEIYRIRLNIEFYFENLTNTQENAQFSGGRQEIFNSLSYNGRALSDEGMTFLCQNGFSDLIKWAYEENRLRPTDFLEIIVKANLLNVIQYLWMTHGVNFRNHVVYAAEAGHIDLIKWFQKRGVDFSIVDIIYRAIYGNQFEVIKEFFPSHEYQHKECLFAIIESGNITWIEWVWNHFQLEAQDVNTRVLSQLIRNNKIDALCFLLSKGVKLSKYHQKDFTDAQRESLNITSEHYECE